MLLCHPAYQHGLTYLDGSVMSDRDLRRAAAGSAKAAFILCDKFADVPDAEDSRTILRALSVKRQVFSETGRDIPVYVQLIRPENKQLFTTTMLSHLHYAAAATAKAAAKEAVKQQQSLGLSLYDGSAGMPGGSSWLYRWFGIGGGLSAAAAAAAASRSPEGGRSDNVSHTSISSSSSKRLLNAGAGSSNSTIVNTVHTTSGFSGEKATTIVVRGRSDDGSGGSDGSGDIHGDPCEIVIANAGRADSKDSKSGIVSNLIRGNSVKAITQAIVAAVTGRSSGGGTPKHSKHSANNSNSNDGNQQNRSASSRDSGNDNATAVARVGGASGSPRSRQQQTGGAALSRTFPTAASVADLSVCIQEIKLNLLAKSCLCPGLTTLVHNLVTSHNDDEDGGGAGGGVDDNETSWLEEYSAGMEYEIYRVPLSPVFEGSTFREAAATLYAECNIVLFALDIDFPLNVHGHGHIRPNGSHGSSQRQHADAAGARRSGLDPSANRRGSSAVHGGGSGGADTRLVLNPGSFIIPGRPFKLYGFLIASDKKEADLATYYGLNRSRRRSSASTMGGVGGAGGVSLASMKEGGGLGVSMRILPSAAAVLEKQRAEHFAAQAALRGSNAVAGANLNRPAVTTVVPATDATAEAAPDAGSAWHAAQGASPAASAADVGGFPTGWPGRGMTSPSASFMRSGTPTPSWNAVGMDSGAASGADGYGGSSVYYAAAEQDCQPASPSAQRASMLMPGRTKSKAQLTNAAHMLDGHAGSGGATPGALGTVSSDLNLMTAVGVSGSGIAGNYAAFDQRTGFGAGNDAGAALARMDSDNDLDVTKPDAYAAPFAAKQAVRAAGTASRVVNVLSRVDPRSSGHADDALFPAEHHLAGDSHIYKQQVHRSAPGGQAALARSESAPTMAAHPPQQPQHQHILQHTLSAGGPRPLPNQQQQQVQPQNLPRGDMLGGSAQGGDSQRSDTDTPSLAVLAPLRPVHPARPVAGPSTPALSGAMGGSYSGPTANEPDIEGALACRRITKHILVCTGDFGNLTSFVAPLRAPHLTEHAAIIVLHPNPPSSMHWNKTLLFDHVYYIQGSPFESNDLIRAGIMTARSVVLFSMMGIAGSDELSKSHSGASGGAAAADPMYICMYRLVRTLNPDLEIVCEIASQGNVPFLANSGNADEAFTCGPFAAGHVFTPATLDILLVQCYFNHHIISALTHLLTGGEHEAGKTRSWRSRVCKSGFEHAIEGLTESQMYLVDVPHEWTHGNKTYGQLFNYMALHLGIICMALRRQTAHEHDGVDNSSDMRDHPNEHHGKGNGGVQAGQSDANGVHQVHLGTSHGTASNNKEQSMARRRTYSLSSLKDAVVGNLVGRRKSSHTLLLLDKTEGGSGSGSMQLHTPASAAAQDGPISDSNRAPTDYLVPHRPVLSTPEAAQRQHQAPSGLLRVSQPSNAAAVTGSRLAAYNPSEGGSADHPMMGPYSPTAAGQPHAAPTQFTFAAGGGEGLRNRFPGPPIDGGTVGAQHHHNGGAAGHDSRSDNRSRASRIASASASKLTSLPYVYTNPAADTVLRSGDTVFVLSQVDPAQWGAAAAAIAASNSAAGRGRAHYKHAAAGRAL